MVTFDLPERTVRMPGGHIDATVTLRGNEVVAFDPPGDVGPLWQNKPAARATAPELARTYFVPAETVHW